MKTTSNKKRSYLLPVALMLFLPGSIATANKSGDTLTFGVVPQQSAEKLIRLWHPIMRQLSKDTGRTIRFATAPSIGEFEKRCEKGKYDIAYMNSYLYIRVAKKIGYRVVVNQSNKKLRGIVVVRKDAPIKSLADLNGARIHFPSSVAFGASLLTRAALNQAGVSYTPHYAGSHDSVYLNVMRGRAVAGGGVMRTFKVQPAGVHKQLRVLFTTKGYTPHAIAVHPQIDPKIRKAITSSLLGLPAELLAPLKFNPLQVVSDKEYNDVRSLGIEKMVAH